MHTTMPIMTRAEKSDLQAEKFEQIEQSSFRILIQPARTFQHFPDAP